MRIQVTGRQVDVGDALRTRIEEEFETGVTKYFGRPTGGAVTVSRHGVGFECDALVHLSSGISLQAHGHGGDAHAAFDNALEKITKRVRRYKRRLKNHHNTQKSPLPAEDARAYVLSPIQEDAHEDDEGDVNAVAEPDGAPLVIAEATTPIRTMAVATAVLQLELSDSPALLFRNPNHGGLNMVYKRNDGNVGWVDPERGGQRQH
ncbi:MAG: ribosome-associated translation inhibitor RaiA [Alphaproteobacteria bacterium]|jgi:ribosomal subunit interface protein|nr:ribosome-associated translation inhibitor RaiA [Alphaproteobacteria bacterium]